MSAAWEQPGLTVEERARAVMDEHGKRYGWSTYDAAVEAVTAALRVAVREAVEKTSIPPLDDHLREILGKPNFACIHLAEALRRGGAEIERKAEAEQAAVIHWLLTKYAEHGAAWREMASEEIVAIKDRARAEGGGE